MVVQPHKTSKSGAQQYYFTLGASFNSWLTLIILSLALLSLFLAWPQSQFSWFNALFIFCLFITLGLISYLLWSHHHWFCHFSLNQNGSGMLDSNQAFVINTRPFITAFVSIIYIEITQPNANKVAMIWVWSDMLDDTSYRHLCRLLTQNS